MGEGGGSYRFTIGHGPEPAFADAGQRFLVGDDIYGELVTVEKDDGTLIDAIDVTYFPLGQDRPRDRSHTNGS